MDYSIIDAFTTQPYAGNPASVIVFPEDQYTEYPSYEVLQSIAAEFNLSETAFLLRDRTSSYAAAHPTFRLRWLSPKVEIDLCGHATLGKCKKLDCCIIIFR
jgi:PhzF family phenazine biosynthesis protein